MACKGTRVTEKEKKRMWELYQEIGCYKTIAKKLRRNPNTVSRYVAEYEMASATANHIIQKNKGSRL